MNELRIHAEARRILAGLLCEPDNLLIREGEVVSRLVQALEIIAPGFRLPEFESGEGDELLVAYTKLFLGPGRIPAPPYGSVYLDGDGLLSGPSTHAVKSFYAENNLGVAEDAAELPDHVAIELEFSAHLLDLAAETNDVKERADLLRRHEEFDSRFLRPWLPEFGRRIQAAGIHPLYDAIGTTLRVLPAVEFVESERAE